MPIDLAEFNTIVTFLGCLCATIQMGTGYYAGYVLRRPALLTTDRILNRSHRAFGSFATAFYMMGLFMGTNSLVGALRTGDPPLELRSISFNVHTWPSIVIVAVFLWKIWLSYFNKGPLYKNRKWLGPAVFLAWSFTWITAAISYYVRTLPSNPQHPPPSFLLPYSLVGVQIAMPFLLGAIIVWPIIGKHKRSLKEK
ncbi:MAG: hypothetical protein JSV00_10620 [bacterium]|nr:MAG: hypothetical protein JSV00_10620 [bacterium]